MGPLARLVVLVAFSASISKCCAPPLEVDPDAAPPPGPYPVSADPVEGEAGVFIDKVLRTEFSDHIDGHGIERSVFRLGSGPVSMWVMFYYDPVRKKLVVWPSSLLRKNAVWVFELKEGLTGLEGNPVEPGIVTSFRTGAETGDDMPFPWLYYDGDVAPIFNSRCASCHGGALPMAGLSLEDVDDVRQTAVNVPADGWSGWDRIVPSRPGESYLIYKIIGDRRISGKQMPRILMDGEQAQPLSQQEMETISDWIASGTLLSDLK